VRNKLLGYMNAQKLIGHKKVPYDSELLKFSIYMQDKNNMEDGNEHDYQDKTSGLPYCGNCKSSIGQDPFKKRFYWEKDYHG
jgi:hypothetical protein